ncbi:MAG: hypothetical protein ABF242_07420 [Flavobacteriales bacterium]
MFTKTLIDQVYDGDWSFGDAVWSTDNNKFYFDSSGAVACIWELDVPSKTLDKIVPSHSAHSPVYFFDTTDAIMYCDEKCIFLTRKKIKLEIFSLRFPLGACLSADRTGMTDEEVFATILLSLSFD